MRELLRWLRGGLVGGLVVLVVLVGFVSVAWGAAPFNEVGRFGCSVTKACAGPRFGLPVGFAVAASEENGGLQEENNVFVLDRTVDNTSEGLLEYRLQKLASPGSGDAGQVLGSVTGEEEHYHDLAHFSDAHPVIGLAVDPGAHRVYSLVESIVNGAPVADELVAWSTTPNGEGELERAPKPEPGTPGYEVEGELHASVVAKFEPESTPAGEQLFSPEALAVEPATGDVAIEAQKGQGGPPIIELVRTHGEHSGTLESGWYPSAVNGEEVPGGLIAKPGKKSFAIDMIEGLSGAGRISQLLEVSEGDLESDLTAPGPEAGDLIPEEGSGSRNLDEAASLNDIWTPNFVATLSERVRGPGLLETFLPGSPIAELSDGDYAASYGLDAGPTDPQSEAPPWENQPTFFSQVIDEENNVGRMGVRVFNSSGEIVETIGGDENGNENECNIPFERFAVAAGANDSVFVLTDPNEEHENEGDEVIEFSATGTKDCPQPSGEITINGVKTNSATVKQGETVTLDAFSLERAGDTPFEFDWKLSETEQYKLGSKIEDATGFEWPNPVETHVFSEPKTYHATLRLKGSFGVNEFPFTITVTPEQEAVTEFTCEEPVLVDQTTKCSAAASKGADSTPIVSYHWEWGDGTPASETTTPTTQHEYTTLGEHTIKLTITYEITPDHFEKAAPKEHTIEAHKNTAKEQKEKQEQEAKAKAEAEAKTKQEQEAKARAEAEAKTKQEQEAKAKAEQEAKAKQEQEAKAKAKPTRAQLLQKALNACHKIKNKHKRAACETQAHKKYNPPHKKTPTHKT